MILEKHGSSKVVDEPTTRRVPSNMRIWAAFAQESSDTDDERVEKVSAFIVAAACCVAGLVWTAMYLAVFGWGRIAALPLSFVVIVGSALVLSHARRDHRYAVYAQIVCIIFITAGIQWSIGGIFESGLVVVWAFLGPVTALIFFSRREAIIWFAVFAAVLAVTVGFNEAFAAHGEDVSDAVQLGFVAMNLGVSSAVVFAFAGYFVWQAAVERTKSRAALDDLQRVNQLLDHLSMIDPLTGLANRRGFDEQLQVAWDSAVRGRHWLGLAMIDVDHFKGFNDHYGHQAGDDCLSRVAFAMAEALRRPGDVVARYGGEEFVAILVDTGSEGAAEVAERLRAAVEQAAIPHEVSSVRPVVTVSVGIAVGDPARHGDVALLLKAADDAMYDAKHAGRNQISVRNQLSRSRPPPLPAAASAAANRGSATTPEQPG